MAGPWPMASNRSSSLRLRPAGPPRPAGSVPLESPARGALVHGRPEAPAEGGAAGAHLRPVLFSPSPCRESEPVGQPCRNDGREGRRETGPPDPPSNVTTDT